jgi:hypothetical protein
MSCPPLATVAPTTNLTDALELTVACGVDQLPVRDGKRAAHMITRAEIRRVLQVRAELERQSVDKPSMQSVPGRPRG